ncbi:MAG TPA: DoxX family protein [Flavisolibacter sp.]|nr:DoxX family protein [Flavisolibacter sp.]
MKKLFSTKTSDTSFTIATLLLRLGFGGLMLVNYGWHKLTHYAEMQRQVGDPLGLGPTVSLALVVFAEFFCSAFVILGLFTRLACIPLIIAMGVAFFKVHHMIYSTGQHSGQTALIFFLAFLIILFTGPGKVSLDRLIGK